MNGENAKIDDKVITRDGKSATIIGFQEIDYGLIHNDGMLPGIYRNCHLVEIKLGNGTTIYETDNDLSLDSKGAIQSQFRERDRSINRKCHSLIFDRPLPASLFWEYDVVQISKHSKLISKVKALFSRTNNLIVVRIDYLSIETSATLKTANPCYEISDSTSNNSKLMVKESDLDLVERGLVWNYYHKQILEFSDFKARAEFFHLLGKTQTIQNQNGTYAWNYTEAIEMVKSGLAHGLVSNDNNRYTLVVFKDQALGDTVARLTIKNKLILRDI